jgi:DNA-binding SARP family transcriptional activator
MVDYFLSGAVAAHVDGRKTSLGGPKQRCVLALLLANHGSTVSIDRLVTATWQDEQPAKALTSLRAYVANLRRLLTSPADPVAPARSRLESRPSGYQLNLLADDSVDLHKFEELVRSGHAALSRADATRAFDTLTSALTLWRGDPFGEFVYGEFFHGDALRYGELRNTAIEARFDAALRLGDGRDLIPEMETAVTQDPLQERLWAHLMLAFYRTGRTADAIGAFDRVRDSLDREIGTLPGERLQTLYRKICDGSTDLLDVESPSRSVAVDIDARSTFVGRTAELATIAASITRARTGSGGLIVVTGESGVGKTSLAQEVCDSTVKFGQAVAWATHPSDIQVPLMWPWIQILRRLGSELGRSSRDVVRQIVPGVVDALVPEWNDDGDVASAIRTPATGFHLVEGVVSALRELSSVRPLLLVLDDLQLADSASAEALLLLTGELPRLPIQVIGNWTYLGKDRPINRPSFDRLIRSSGTATVHLRGIDHDAAAPLIDVVAGKPIPTEVFEYVWTRAGGNPFYIKELVRALAVDDRLGTVPESSVENVSDAVAGVVARRLSALDEACRDALAAAAVMGPEFEVALLADILKVTVAAARTQLRPADETGLLDECRDRPGVYRFSHGLLRDAILAQVPTADRTSLHASIAARQADALQTASYEDAIAAADHAWLAGPDLDSHKALDIHDVVIRRARTRSAYDDVAVLAEHSLQICRRLPPDPEPLERQAILWMHLAGVRSILDGQTSKGAADAVQRAFEVGEHAKGRNFFGTVAIQAHMLCGQGRIDEAQTLANGLADEYAHTLDPDIGVASSFTQVMIHCLRGDLDAQTEVAHKMLAEFPVPDSVVDPLNFFHPRVYCWLGLREALRSNRKAAHDYCLKGLELAQTHRDAFNVLAAKLTMVEIDAILGVLDGTAAAAEIVYHELTATGADQWAACAKMVAVWARTLTTGDVDPSEALDAFDVYTDDGSTAMTPFFLALLADIEKHHRRSRRAYDLLLRAQAVASATGERVWDDLLAQRLAALPLTTKAGRSA